ncbi:hypothetical protein D3C72_2578850 [compost metagenome]
MSMSPVTRGVVTRMSARCENGSQPSQALKIIMKTSPSQKIGMDTPNSEPDMAA